MFNFIRRNRTESLMADRIAELEAQVKTLSASNGTLRGYNKNLVEDIERLSGVIPVKALTRIKFIAFMPDGTNKETDFVLGPGRCGKTVEQLELKRTSETFEITQWHTDGSKKVFTYRDGDIVGRVQECYEVVNVQPNTFYIERVRQRQAWERRNRMMMHRK